MNLIPEISNMREMVIDLLTKAPHLRSDDERLKANVWHRELKAMRIDPKISTITDFLTLLASGKLSNSETIRRTRQKVQEDHPELRGNNYRIRKEAGSTVRKNINAA